MSLARDLADGVINGLTPQASNMQPHNLIINGNMAIWQRGVSQTSTGYGCVDRFRNTVSGTVTFAQETTGLPSGFAYALKWTTGAGTSYGQVRQFIETENVKSLRSKTLTASAYVKVSSNYSGVISWEIGYSTGGDGSGASYTVLASTNATTASSSDASADYKRIYCNVTIPADAVGLYIGIVPSVVQATGVYCSITGVQLEAGSSASPFAHENYGDTLRKCQRYFWSLNSNGMNNKYLGQGVNYNSVSCYAHFPFPTKMRSIPTLIPSDVTHFQVVENGSLKDASGVTLSGASTNQGAVVIFSASVGIGNASLIRTDENTNVYLWFDAEL